MEAALTIEVEAYDEEEQEVLVFVAEGEIAR